MRGVAVGESTGVANPILQLLFRSGPSLIDPASVSFSVDRINDPSVAPTEVAASAALDLVTSKMNTGRFAVPLDATGFQTGTHRLVVTFVTVAGGLSRKRVVEFEVLDATEYPTGASYFTYCSTRRVFSTGVSVYGLAAPETYHEALEASSHQLEELLGQWFEPRYVELRLDGAYWKKMALPVPVIALDGVDTVTYNADGSETFVALDTAGAETRVYNRHLDGVSGADDDRYAPALASSALYQKRRQRYRVRGIFGFTDPEIANQERADLGRTPKEIRDVVMVLAHRLREDPTFSSLTTWKPGLTKSYKTRHQAIQFHGASGSITYSGGITGDAMLDERLLRFVAPGNVTYIERYEPVPAIEL